MFDSALLLPGSRPFYSIQRWQDCRRRRRKRRSKSQTAKLLDIVSQRDTPHHARSFAKELLVRHRTVDTNTPILVKNIRHEALTMWGILVDCNAHL